MITPVVFTSPLDVSLFIPFCPRSLVMYCFVWPFLVHPRLLLFRLNERFGNHSSAFLETSVLRVIHRRRQTLDTLVGLVVILTPEVGSDVVLSK